MTTMCVLCTLDYRCNGLGLGKLLLLLIPDEVLGRMPFTNASRDMMHSHVLQSVPLYAKLASGCSIAVSFFGHCARECTYILSSCVAPDDAQTQAEATAAPLAYCRAARQPAATASASVQNQRSPDAASTCEAPHLVRAFSLTSHTI